MGRPVNLVDTLHDFGPNNDIPLSININTSTFSDVYFSLATQAEWNQYASTGLSIKNFHSVNNQVLGTNLNNTPVTDFVDINGNKIPPSTNYSTITYNFISTSPTTHNPVSNTPTQVTLLKTRPNSNLNFKNGIILQPGSYASTHYFYFHYPEQIIPSFVRWNQYQTARYFYNIFQKSIAILEDITTVPTVVNNQTLSNINLNDRIRVSKAKSRGKEIASNWIVQVRDSGGNFIPATQGVDYNITFGSLGADTLEVEILQVKLYKIICNIAGYTSNNNNFYSPAGTGDVTVNTDSAFYLLDATSAVNNTQDIITLPKIISNVTIQNQISNVPVPTGYAGTTISINGELDLTSGSYIIKNLTTGIDTPVTLDNAQWIQELNTRTNITVEIKNKDTSALILTKDGLGPHENITLPQGNYTIQYKTVLK